MNAPVAKLFTELAGREHDALIESDLAKIPADELADDFRDVIRVLDGLMVSGESMGVGSYIVLSNAKDRAREALRRVGGGEAGGAFRDELQRLMDERGIEDLEAL
jgi:hypothetical protein